MKKFWILLSVCWLWTCSGGGEKSPTEPIIPEPIAPTAQNLNLTTNEDTPALITLIGNDSNNKPLTYTITQNPVKGNFSLSGPTGTYTPNSNFNGSDEFKYIVSNGIKSSDTATVSITVNPVDDNPESVDITITTDEDVPTTFTLQANEYDGDEIRFQIDTYPNNGILTLSGKQVNYQPNENWFGVDSFEFSVFDDNDRSIKSGNGTIVVNSINDSPSSDDIYDVIAEYNKIEAIPLVGGDVDGDNLSFELFTDPNKGTVTVSNDTAYFSPTSGYGADTFQYRTFDGSSYSQTSNVYIDITDPGQHLIDFGANTFYPSSSRAALTLENGNFVFGGVSYDQTSYTFFLINADYQIIKKINLPKINANHISPIIVENNENNILVSIYNLLYVLDSDLNVIETHDLQSDIYEIIPFSNDEYFINNNLFNSSFEPITTGFDGNTLTLVFDEGVYYRVFSEDGSIWLNKYDSSFTALQDKVLLFNSGFYQSFVAEGRLFITHTRSGNNEFYGSVFDLNLNHLFTKEIVTNDNTNENPIYKSLIQVNDGFVHQVYSLSRKTEVAKLNNDLNRVFVSDKRFEKGTQFLSVSKNTYNLLGYGNSSYELRQFFYIGRITFLGNR